jgi:hypothetical protein
MNGEYIYIFKGTIMAYFNILFLYAISFRVCGGNEKYQSARPVTRLKLEPYASKPVEHSVIYNK